MTLQMNSVSNRPAGRKPSRWVKTLLVGAMAMSAVSAQAAPPNAKALIEGKYADIQKIISTDTTDQGVRAKVTEVLASFTDFREFGRLTIKTSWADLTAKQQQQFVDKYRQLIQKSYLKHFKAGQPLKVAINGEPLERKGKVLVKTTVTSGKTEADVNYKLHVLGDALMAYDIVIDDVSLMRSYRKQFSGILKRDGFKALIDKMTRKIEKDAGDLHTP